MEQITMLSFMPWTASLKGHEKDWLIANGYKNIYYEKPPHPGLYEWANIEHPDKTRYLNYGNAGGSKNSDDFSPTWWREIPEDKKEAYRKKIAPKDIPLGSGGYTVWIIKYEWMPNRWLGVWNKRGNCLEFYDKAHAEIFLQQHPESIHGHPFCITPRTYSVDDADQMEYGNKYNVWENE
jgi:hypothetical protein